MLEFKESKFYKLLQDFFINNNKETFLQMLGEFYNRTESIIEKDENQDKIINELRELYLELNEKGIDENIVIEKVNYFVENNVKIKDIIVKLIINTNKIEDVNTKVSTNTNNIENVTSQLEHIEQNKATKNDVQVLNERVNSLATLEEGSTTGDAELIDGRIGEDGITYDNIGGAIRNQLNKIDQYLLKENINFSNEGYYIDKDGKDTGFSGWAMSDFIKVNKGDIVQVTALGYSTNVSAIYFYNDNKERVKALQISNDTEQTYTKVIDDNGYIKCSGKITNKLSGTVSRINPEITNNFNYYNDNFKLNITINGWTKGSYICITDGKVTALSNDYSYTDYIDITDLDNVFMNITEYYDYRAGIAFYDENKNFISGIGCDGIGANPNLGQIKEVQLKGQYMRLTCKTSYINNFRLYTSLKQIVKTINGTYKNSKDINPCFYNGNLNLIKMFNKVACIGDSYTEGSIEYKTSNGQTLQSIDKRYSYPTQLSKIANIETVNLGHAGYTTSQWYNKYKDTDLSGYDCAIIFLGINDWYGNSGRLDTNAYTNIINKLRTDNKNIPIFCVTITQNYSGSACNLNNAIREVGTNNNCYIIDLGQYSDWGTNSKWLNGSHPNAYGYYHNAEMINSYINYIIENNKADFYNLSFVGTDKIDF